MLPQILTVTTSNEKQSDWVMQNLPKMVTKSNWGKGEGVVRNRVYKLYV